MGKFKSITERAAGVLLAAVLFAGFFGLMPEPAAAAGGSCGANATWDYTGTTLTISGTGAVSTVSWRSAQPSVKKIIISSGITSMPAYSFDGYQTVESVEIADTVTSIGVNFCYGCSALKQIRFSKSLKAIPNNAFYNCGSLTSLDLPSGLESIGSSAFYGTLGLKELKLPDTVTTVMAAAFFGTNIKSLTLSSSLKSIGAKAFSPACFPSVVIPDSVETIGDAAIGVCYEYVQANGGSFTGRASGSPVVTVLYGKPGGVAEAYAKKANLKFAANNGTAHTHSWSEWTVKTPAGCETAGEQIRTCSCGESESKTIPATGHSFGTPQYAWSADRSSCTASRTCASCGKAESETASSTYAVTKEAGASTPGEGVYTAKFSNSAFSAQTVKVEIPATGQHTHTWSAWTVKTPAGCETEGLQTRTCTGCKETESQKITATGHSFGTPQYAWSADHSQCTASITCANCGKTESETAKSSYAVTRAAGVGTPGEGVYTAKFSSSKFSAQSAKVEIPAINSQWSTPEYTWSTDGKSCTASRREANSGKTETETVEAVYSVSVAATCTKKGKGVYTASFANTAFSAQTKTVDIPAKGHIWGAWTTDIPAGCETDGREIRTCVSCGETELRLTDATGHSWSDWSVKTAAGCETAGTEIRTCANCRKTEEREIRALGHDWSEWKTTREATIDKGGLQESKCARCGKVRTQETPVLTSYVISVSANEGGNVNPAGELRVAEGGSQSISFAANNGYKIAAVLVDGESVSQNGSITLRDVRENHTVSVVFQQLQPQVVRSCIAVSASPKRSVWLKDESAYSMNDFTVIAVISENGNTVEKDISKDCYTDAKPANTAAVTFKYRGSDQDIKSYFSKHGIGCTVPVHLRGDSDLNGKVEVEDAMLALKNYVYQVAGKQEQVMTDIQKTVTDVDGKDGATLIDATYILRYYTKTFAGLKPTWADVIV